MATGQELYEQVYAAKDLITPALGKMSAGAKTTARDLQKLADVAKRSIGVQVTPRFSQSAQRYRDTSSGRFAKAPDADADNSGGLAKILGMVKGLGPVLGSIGTVAQSVLGVLLPIIGAIGQIALGVTALGAALAAFGVYAMVTAGRIEGYRKSLVALLGSQEEAARQFKRIEALAKLPGLGYEEAFQSFNKIFSAGADARLTERILMAFGNVATTIGAGREQVELALYGLSQVLSTGKLQGDELRQITDALPLIRTVMKDAFGTADSEDIAKRFTGQEFVAKLTDALEKLPKAGGGAKTFFENLGDLATRSLVKIGDVLNRVVLPELEKVATFVEGLVEGGWFTEITESLVGAFSDNRILGAIGDLAKKAGEGVGNIAVGGARNIGGVAGESLAGVAIQGNILKKIGEFVFSGGGLGETLKRMLALSVVAFQHVPEIVDGVVGVLKGVGTSVVDAINGFIDFLNTAGQALFQILDKLDITGEIDANSFKKIARIGEGDDSFLKSALDNVSNLVARPYVEEAQAILDAVNNRPKDEDLSKDPNKGGFRTGDKRDTTAEKIEKNTRETADSLKDALRDTFLGGGAAAKGALAATNLSRLAAGVPDLGSQIGKLIDDHIRSVLGSQLVASTSGLR